MRPPKSLPACLEPLPEAQVEELWQAGFPIRDIARRCNATFAQVHLLVRDKGWQVRGRRRIPGDILGPRACEMIELFLSNDVNAREVGDTFDVSRSYVAWIAQQYRDLR